MGEEFAVSRSRQFPHSLKGLPNTAFSPLVRERGLARRRSKLLRGHFRGIDGTISECVAKLEPL